jgi:heterodisulfide reductase subunit A-like polyferredoxin
VCQLKRKNKKNFFHFELKMSSNNNSNVLQIFDSFIISSNVKSLLIQYKLLNECLNLNNLYGFQYFVSLKKQIQLKSTQKWVRISAILSKLEKRFQQKIYSTNRSLNNSKNCLVIGGGISGLRVSIDLLLLGNKGINQSINE